MIIQMNFNLRFKIKIFTLLILFSFMPVRTMGQVSFSQNHTYLKWRKFETTHFEIIYHKGIEILAEQVAGDLEAKTPLSAQTENQQRHENQRRAPKPCGWRTARTAVSSLAGELLGASGRDVRVRITFAALFLFRTVFHNLSLGLVYLS